ncbi:MAG TPA: hypothetical protein VIS94_13990 [Desulfomonilia bacterium]
MKDYEIPTTGWYKDGSFSYGADYLYESIPKVAVRIFNDNEKTTAEYTYNYLKSIGIKTAKQKYIQHTDNKWYYYVFAERTEFISKLKEVSVEIELENKNKL